MFKYSQLEHKIWRRSVGRSGIVAFSSIDIGYWRKINRVLKLWCKRANKKENWHGAQHDRVSKDMLLLMYTILKKSTKS
jgi:hypothetical protein